MTRSQDEFRLTLARRREAFEAKVDRSAGPEGCVADNGYGQFGWRRSGKKKVERAHRVAFGIANGWLPEGVTRGSTVIRHTCDNRRCCNPAHLIPGSQRDNIHDAMERGRMHPTPRRYGADAHNFKLSRDVIQQAAFMAGQGIPTAEVARRLDIGWTTAKRAIAGYAR